MPCLSHIASSLLFCTLASAVSAQSLLQQHGEVVLGSGEAVPGLPGVTVALSAAASIPVLDLNGNMLWRARLEGAGITPNANDQALFYGRTANVRRSTTRR